MCIYLWLFLDAFMGRGEPAVATNIINHTYRIQAWDFSRCTIPDLTDSKYIPTHRQ